MVAGQPAGDHAGDLSNQSEPRQLADLHIIEQPIVELRVWCENEVSLAPAQRERQRERRLLAGGEVVELHAKARPAVVLPHRTKERERVERQPLEEPDLARLQRDRAVETEAEAVD